MSKINDKNVTSPTIKLLDVAVDTAIKNYKAMLPHLTRIYILTVHYHF